MILTILITVVHVIVCLFLILVVLAQQGKGQDLASAFGGAGSQTAFGARGTATLLSKITAAAAAIFMITSLTLSYLRPAVAQKTVVPDSPAPATETSTPSTESPTPIPPTEQPSTAAPAPPTEEKPTEAPPTGATQPGATSTTPSEQKPPQK